MPAILLYISPVDLDECGVGTASCDPNSDCVDTDGSYDCICRAGYTGDGRLSCAGMHAGYLVRRMYLLK